MGFFITADIVTDLVFYSHDPGYMLYPVEFSSM